MSAAVLVLASSNVTTACFLSKSTTALLTPSILVNASLTVRGHVAQVMFDTFNVIVLDPAQAGLAIRITATTAHRILFIAVSSARCLFALNIGTAQSTGS